MGRKRRRAIVHEADRHSEKQPRTFSTASWSEVDDADSKPSPEVTHITQVDDLILWFDGACGSVRSGSCLAIGLGAWQVPLWETLLPGAQAASCVAGMVPSSPLVPKYPYSTESESNCVILVAMNRGMLLAVDAATGSIAGHARGLARPALDATSNDVAQQQAPQPMLAALSAVVGGSGTPLPQRGLAVVGGSDGSLRLAWTQATAATDESSSAPRVDIASIPICCALVDMGAPVTCVAAAATTARGDGGSTQLVSVTGSAHGTVQATSCILDTTALQSTYEQACISSGLTSAPLAVLPARITAVVCLIPSLEPLGASMPAAAALPTALPAALGSTSLWCATDRAGHVAVFATLCHDSAGGRAPSVILLARSCVTPMPSPGGEAAQAGGPREEEGGAAQAGGPSEEQDGSTSSSRTDGLLACVSGPIATAVVRAMGARGACELRWEQRFFVAGTAGTVMSLVAHLRVGLSPTGSPATAVSSISAEIEVRRETQVASDWVVALSPGFEGSVWTGSLCGQGAPQLWKPLADPHSTTTADASASS